MIISPEEYVQGTIAHIERQKRGKGNPRTRRKIYYKNVITAFDIETSRLKDIEQSIMYVWAFHIHHHYTILGRTWEEFDKIIKTIVLELEENTIVIWVHNLSYEFQFLRAIYDFQPDEVFAVESRKVLKCTMYGGKIEFRCSYLHSNMSLAEYTNKMDVEHKKLDGEEFNYNIVRYPWTPLTELEQKYVCHDVIGLCEALEKEMETDNDNLYTIPITSTGYVRRDAKRAMRNVHHDFVKEQLPDLEIYKMLREAFRGGNTHANRYYADTILYNVKSADRSSSYPEVLCNCQFPITSFFIDRDCDYKRLIYLMETRKKAILTRVALSNIRLSNEFWGCPYLSKDKCRNIIGGVFDNGRILEAEYLETTLTDIDLKIVINEYDFDDLCTIDVAYARYGKLPEPFTAIVKEYYRLKTELKDIDGQEIYYMKSKNKLNSLYGMCAQDPVKQSIIYDNGEWKLEDTPIVEIFDRATGKAWLPYQWGVWCTAHARNALEEGIKLAGNNFVYADTDSVKYLDTVDFSEYNKGRIEASINSGAYATDKKGTTHYMGVYEADGFYSTFKTLGAKKYAYTLKDGGETHVTIAGVNKKKGGKELDKYGGLEAFKDGFVFVEAGGTESIYNDNPEITEYKADNRTIKITPNVVIKESTYTLGLTAEYEEVLKNAKIMLDFLYRL